MHPRNLTEKPCWSMDMHVRDDVKCKPRKRENKEPANKEKMVEGVHYIRERKSEFSQQ